MKEEYENQEEDCLCQKCKKIIPVGDSVYVVNDDWANLCGRCLEDLN